jgi:tyrosyl-tRNA synthetase
MAAPFFCENGISFVEVRHNKPKGGAPADYARAVNLPLAYIGQTVLVRGGDRIVGVVYSGDAKLNLVAVAKALSLDAVELVHADQAARVAGVPARAVSPAILWGKTDLLWDARVARLPVLCLPTESEENSVRIDTRQLRRVELVTAAVAEKTIGADSQSGYDVLLERGFIERVSDEAAARRLLSKSDVSVYNGFDPTADSLHVGSLVPIMALANTQRAGAHVIAVVGGATGLVGDPSGKTELRKMLTRDDIKANLNGISEQLSSYLDMGERGKLVDNADWFTEFGALEFLRELGPHFSINQMIKSESVKTRMEREGEGLTYLELTYMLLQAYDFVRLAEDENCLVQMGGSDQWGNICAGIDLGRRATGATLFGREVKKSEGLAGVTFPLLTKASGGKFGKSESGNVWLSDERTSVYDFFQFWRNTDDADLVRFFGLFTFIPLEEIATLCAGREAKELNLAKEVLAFAVTSLRHGVEKAIGAAANARGLFGGYEEAFGDEVVRLGLAEASALEALTKVAAKSTQAKGTGAKSVEVTEGDVAGMTVVDALVKLGLASSKGEVKRLIKQGGVYVEGERVDAIDTKLPSSSAGSHITLPMGKKKHGIIDVVA